MQVSVSVDEADIGRVRIGQRVTFKVDSFPDRSFEGWVQLIQKASQEKSNVVTYTVIVSAGNPEQVLLPGMTASVKIVVGEREDTLKLPNAALRLRLPDRLVAPQRSGDWVWVSDETGNTVQLVPVGVGIANANETEIVSGELSEGQKVIVGIAPAARPDRWKWLRLGS
jgi:HlyD family secretion protein